MAQDPIDWFGIATDLGLIEYTENGRSEWGGTRQAEAALVQILGPAAIRAAVDFYVTMEPGSELARSVLMLLKPSLAMEHCQAIFLSATDPLDRRLVIGLLGDFGDERVLDWAPAYLADEDAYVQLWGIGVVKTMLLRGVVEPADCERLLDFALAHENVGVREQAQAIRSSFGSPSQDA